MSELRPLADVQIVAVEQYGAGPWGTLHLAELGAEVIKIEDPRTRGDIGRYVLPFQEGEDSLFFETFNRNKRSIDLDISVPAGRRVFEDLVRCSDVVYSNLRGDVPERLGLTYADLSHLNERIVCCSLTGYGMTGPRRAEPGYDYLLQGVAGWMSLTGEPGGPPTKTGLSVVDLSGGFVAAISVLAGVHAARRDGRGMDCDLSLFDVALSMLNYPGTWYLTEGYEAPRTEHSAHPSLVPFQNFATADGWIVVACPKDKFWERLTEAVERPDLASDARFSDFAARRENASQLLPELEQSFALQSSAFWLERLAAHGVPCSPINDLGGAAADPQSSARGLIVETDHPRFGVVRQVTSPVRVGREPPPQRRAPARNEDADYVLTEPLAYDDDTVRELVAGAAFGPEAAE
jgi:crotonobetainyl-CoA:carnitine CoA-transferase CaiB-like acyl-CoA transferase